jgi:hypothetical protein
MVFSKPNVYKYEIPEIGYNGNVCHKQNMDK